MSKAIGGYLELELRKGEHYHPEALRLNSARNCFEYIMRVRNYKKIYIPYYTCETVLEPFKRVNAECVFYSVNELLEPIELPELKTDEAFYYTNYFGLKQACVERLAARYGKQLIVDNAQAFFAPRLTGIDTFYSARKFIGVADGAFLYTDDRSFYDTLEQDLSWDRMMHLLKRMDVTPQFGFEDFHHNEDVLCDRPIMRMSRLTESILENVDYQFVQNKYKENFRTLHKKLKDSNKFDIESIIDNEDVTPFVYPYWTDDSDLRSKLIANEIFVARFWPDMESWCQQNSLELKWQKTALPFPIDQRYGEEEMKRIIELVEG